MLIRNPGNEEIVVAYAEETAQAKKAIKEAKHKAWARECKKMDAGTDNTRLFATIRAMDGRGRKQESAAALKTDNKTAVTAKEEANTVTSQYAKFNQAQYTRHPDSKRTT